MSDSTFRRQFEALLMTYGLMFGTGASLVYTPSLVVLGHYFERRLGLVNGICAMGSSIFTVLMPFIMKSLLSSVDIKGTLLVLSGQFWGHSLSVRCWQQQHAQMFANRSIGLIRALLDAVGGARHKLRPCGKQCRLPECTVCTMYAYEKRW